MCDWLQSEQNRGRWKQREGASLSLLEGCSFQGEHGGGAGLEGFQEGPQKEGPTDKGEILGGQETNTVLPETSFRGLRPSLLRGTLGNRCETKSQLLDISSYRALLCKVYVTFHPFLDYLIRPDEGVKHHVNGGLWSQ